MKFPLLTIGPDAVRQAILVLLAAAAIYAQPAQPAPAQP